MILQCFDTTSTELFAIMSSLLSQLKTRLIKENFLGSFIRATKKYANEAVWKKAVSDFRAFYKNATAYFEIHFNLKSFKKHRFVALNKGNNLLTNLQML